MSEALTTNACVEHEIDVRAAAIEERVGLDVLTYVGPILYGNDDWVREVVESRSPRRDGLAVILETEGGYIEPVRRIVTVLRTHYSHVEFVVPSHAMSAGTILVMSGDVIRMDYYSVLGPIDPQVERDGKMVPAMGYLAQYERLMKKAAEGRASAAEMAILLRFDQAELYSFEQARELSIALLKEWLARYKFKDWRKTETRGLPVTQRMRLRRAQEVAKQLSNTDRWHTHAHGITMEVLRNEIKLRIDDLHEDAELARLVRLYHRLLVDYLPWRAVNIAVHRPGKLLFGKR